MTPEDIKQLVDFQVNEITESKIYSRLANIQKDTHNSEVLKELSAEEKPFSQALENHTLRVDCPFFRSYFRDKAHGERRSSRTRLLS